VFSRIFVGLFVSMETVTNSLKIHHHLAAIISACCVWFYCACKCSKVSAYFISLAVHYAEEAILCVLNVNEGGAGAVLNDYWKE
jgi:hypothetical protein